MGERKRERGGREDNRDKRRRREEGEGNGRGGRGGGGVVKAGVDEGGKIYGQKLGRWQGKVRRMFLRVTVVCEKKGDNGGRGRQEEAGTDKGRNGTMHTIGRE